MPQSNSFLGRLVEQARQFDQATERKILRCPVCGETITSLRFECSTQGWETGSAILNDKTGEIEFHGTDDSGSNECSNYEYTCPECGNPIDPDRMREAAKNAEPAAKTKPPTDEDGRLITEKQKEKMVEELLADDDADYLLTRISFTPCHKCGQLNEFGPREQSVECINCNSLVVRSADNS